MNLYEIILKRTPEYATEVMTIGGQRSMDVVEVIKRVYKESMIKKVNILCN